MPSVYIGIDVACATGKCLPICVVSPGRPITPLVIPKHLAAEIPRGVGNKEITAAAPFEKAAREVVVRYVASRSRWDGGLNASQSMRPRRRPKEGLVRQKPNSGATACRLSERLPREPGLPFAMQCAEHIRQGGATASLPHANKIWMLFGFALFAQLRSDLQAEIIEVYPFAIVRELLPKCQHKSTEQGYRDQLYAVAARTGWDDPAKLEASLKAMVPGSRHDRLDAFMAAWVASLPVEQRRAIGDVKRPDDAIWVPL